MSPINATSMNLKSANLATASLDQRKAMLRKAANEMVGVTFFGQMLKMARTSRLKGKFGHGGRGEDIFGGQLDQELARRAGTGMKNSLSDAIYNRLVEHV